MSDVREQLQERFFARLAAERPASVLDVGCGAGGLLRRCAAAGIAARGIEPDATRVVELRAAGLDVEEARAEALPCPEGAFEWVAIRHVSHHLEDEAPALAEAFRVASVGVIVAEPWLDVSVASQRVALRFDAWLERQHTRTGHVHREAVSVGDFLRALPAGLSPTVRAEYHLHLEPRPDGWLQDEAAPFLADLPEEERRELAAIEAAGAVDGITYNGSAILTMRR